MLSSKGQRFQGNRAVDPVPVAGSMKPWPCFTSKCRKTHGITSWMVYWLKFSRLHMKHWVVSSIYCLLNLIWPQDNGLNGWIHGPVRPKTSCGNAWRSSVAIFPFPLLEVSCQTLQSGTSRSINKLVIGVVFFVGVFAFWMWQFHYGCCGAIRRLSREECFQRYNLQKTEALFVGPSYTIPCDWMKFPDISLGLIYCSWSWWNYPCSCSHKRPLSEESCVCVLLNVAILLNPQCKLCGAWDKKPHFPSAKLSRQIVKSQQEIHRLQAWSRAVKKDKQYRSVLVKTETHGNTIDGWEMHAFG